MKLKRKCKFCGELAFEIVVLVPTGTDLPDTVVVGDLSYLCPSCGKTSIYKKGEEGGFPDKIVL